MKDLLHPLRMFHGQLHERHIAHIKKQTINNWPIELKEIGVMDLYEQKCGYRFDLQNPQSFNEKIQWYKLYYDNSLLKSIVDKYRFKEYIKDTLGEGYTVPMYGAWNSIQKMREEW